jgi:serine phosphatase RsbU (regulator of sigma subunit)
VREDIQGFAGTAEQFDDITMLGFTYFGSGKEE